jgi:hypothetical protein
MAKILDKNSGIPNKKNSTDRFSGLIILLANQRYENGLT